ncbi:MAG: hypothetical protein R3E65_00795, partial [Steroidobacteraceae bacterium]
MTRSTVIASLFGLLMLQPSLSAHAAEPRADQPAADLSRLRLSEDDDVAVRELHHWLTARGMEASINGAS